MAQMKKLWSLLRSGLGISDEERLVLVQGCLNSLLEVCTMYRVASSEIRMLLQCTLFSSLGTVSKKRNSNILQEFA